MSFHSTRYFILAIPHSFIRDSYVWKRWLATKCLNNEMQLIAAVCIILGLWFKNEKLFETFYFASIFAVKSTTSKDTNRKHSNLNTQLNWNLFADPVISSCVYEEVVVVCAEFVRFWPKWTIIREYAIHYVSFHFLSHILYYRESTLCWNFPSTLFCGWMKKHKCTRLNLKYVAIALFFLVADLSRFHGAIFIVINVTCENVCGREQNVKWYRYMRKTSDRHEQHSKKKVAQT